MRHVVVSDQPEREVDVDVLGGLEVGAGGGRRRSRSTPGGGGVQPEVQTGADQLDVGEVADIKIAIISRIEPVVLKSPNARSA